MSLQLKSTEQCSVFVRSFGKMCLLYVLQSVLQCLLQYCCRVLQCLLQSMLQSMLQMLVVHHRYAAKCRTLSVAVGCKTQDSEAAALQDMARLWLLLQSVLQSVLHWFLGVYGLVAVGCKAQDSEAAALQDVARLWLSVGRWRAVRLCTVSAVTTARQWPTADTLQVDRPQTA